MGGSFRYRPYAQYLAYLTDDLFSFLPSKWSNDWQKMCLNSSLAVFMYTSNPKKCTVSRHISHTFKMLKAIADLDRHIGDIHSSIVGQSTRICRPTEKMTENVRRPRDRNNTRTAGAYRQVRKGNDCCV